MSYLSLTRRICRDVEGGHGPRTGWRWNRLRADFINDWPTTARCPLLCSPVPTARHQRRSAPLDDVDPRAEIEGRTKHLTTTYAHDGRGRGGEGDGRRRLCPRPRSARPGARSLLPPSLPEAIHSPCRSLPCQCASARCLVPSFPAPLPFRLSVRVRPRPSPSASSTGDEAADRRSRYLPDESNCQTQLLSMRSVLLRCP